MTPKKAGKVEEIREKVGIGFKCVNLKMVEMQIVLEKEKIGHIFIGVNVTMVNTQLWDVGEKDKTVKENIKNDLKCLQLSHNQKTFDKLLLILFYIV